MCVCVCVCVCVCARGVYTCMLFLFTLVSLLPTCHTSSDTTPAHIFFFSIFLSKLTYDLFSSHNPPVIFSPLTCQHLTNLNTNMLMSPVFFNTPINISDLAIPQVTTSDLSTHYRTQNTCSRLTCHLFSAHLSVTTPADKSPVAYLKLNTKLYIHIRPQLACP